jgi:hypothetical protein
VFAGNITQPATHLAGGKDEQRQDDNADQRQPPLEREHDDENCGSLNNIGDDVDDGITDRILCTDHIVIQTTHQFADLGMREESQ